MPVGPTGISQAEYAYLGRHPELLRQLELLTANWPQYGIVSRETADRTLVDTDDGKSLICVGTRIFTVEAGRKAGFGVAAKGLVTFVAGNGVLVSDVRTPGNPNPWCALMQTDTDRYDVVGAVP